MFIIKLSKNSTMMVSNFNYSQQMVQITTDLGYPKKFKSEKLAQNFINKYGDAGYGLSTKDAVIESI